MVLYLKMAAVVRVAVAIFLQYVLVQGTVSFVVCNARRFTTARQVVFVMKPH